jgi:hypothetical protein
METGANIKKIFTNSLSGKLLFSGIALFCCFVLTPIAGTLMLSWGISLALAYSFVILCTNIIPLIIIGFSFRDISPIKSIIVVVLATGIFRIVADFILSPVPFDLISTPAYLGTIAIYCILLSGIAAGVSLFNKRKGLAIGIIAVGVVLYSLFILKAFLMLTRLGSGNGAD